MRKEKLLRQIVGCCLIGMGFLIGHVVPAVIFIFVGVVLLTWDMPGKTYPDIGGY